MDVINKINKNHKKKEKFQYQIQSDGVSVSVSYSTHLPLEVGNEKRFATIRKKYEGGYFSSEWIRATYTYVALVCRNTTTESETNREIVSNS